jgi:hypothetical protein
MIRSRRLDETVIDAQQDPIAVASAFASVVKNLYRDDKDVTSMIVAGDTGLAYCRQKALVQSDKEKARELKKRGRAIAFNTAANCWPGWGDAGIAIEESHISAAIRIATECLNLVEELALPARALGGALWLIGALELAAGRHGIAQEKFEEAERVFLGDETTAASALMARGYIALARKADPRFRSEGRHALNDALDGLRREGSKEALFFADQIAKADLLLGNG